MRLITNPIQRQIEDLVVRYRHFTTNSYLLARTDRGEILSVKIRPQARVMQLTGNNSPAAFVHGQNEVYLAQEFMAIEDKDLVRFVVAHETGHWVHQASRATDATAQAEIKADSFATYLFPECIAAARKSIIESLPRAAKMMDEMGAVGDVAGIRKTAEKLSVMVERLKVL